MDQNDKEARIHALTALGPLDGRYYNIANLLSNTFSEYALIKYRIYVEVKWLIFLVNEDSIPLTHSALSQIKDFGGTEALTNFLEDIATNFSIEDAMRVKEIESVTNHDVKACELFVAEKLTAGNLETLKCYVHIYCTSEDITNLAYALMLVSGKQIIVEKINLVLSKLRELAYQYASTPMLSHTHGQPATPTTFGKEMGVYYARLETQLKYFEGVEIYGKFNGASGNYAAGVIASPNAPWVSISERFIQSLHPDIKPNLFTTQIEPHDYISRLLNDLKLAMQIIRDLDSDMWSYIRCDYLHQKVVPTEVGSSTMPHKVNPITFENSAGNIKILTGICNSLADELPRSRMQRDLSDSSLLRNLGPVFGHATQALLQTSKGLDKIEVDEDVMSKDIDMHPAVYAEAIQTMLRIQGVSDAYDRLKDYTRGKPITRRQLTDFIYDQPELPYSTCIDLQDALYQANGYIGLSPALALAAIGEQTKNISSMSKSSNPD